jgi:hypothetical protein
MRTADELITEARNRFAELDRQLARLQRLQPNAADTKRLREQRDQARRELLELVCLAETPVGEMGWA